LASGGIGHDFSGSAVRRRLWQRQLAFSSAAASAPAGRTLLEDLDEESVAADPLCPTAKATLPTGGEALFRLPAALPSALPSALPVSSPSVASPRSRARLSFSEALADGREDWERHSVSGKI